MNSVQNPPANILERIVIAEGNLQLDYWEKFTSLRCAFPALPQMTAATLDVPHHCPLIWSDFGPTPLLVIETPPQIYAPKATGFSLLSKCNRSAFFQRE